MLVLYFLLYAAVTLAIVMTTGTAHLRRPQALAVATLVTVALPLGQVRPDHVFYPADHWGMYATTRFPETIHEYLVTEQNGGTYHYPFVDVAFSSPRAFMARLSQLLAACECSASDERLDAAIESLVRLHYATTGRVIVEFAVYERNWSTGRRTLRYRWPLAAPGG